MSAIFTLENFSVEPGKTPLVHRVNAVFNEGEIIGIIGANGAGKSSFLKALTGILPYRGIALFRGIALKKMSAAKRAKYIAYVEQNPTIAWPISVYEAVALGRIPFAATTKKQNEEDEHAIKSAIKLTDIEHLKNRKANTLSGGEFARVMLARALASDTKVLILDEPLSGLDLKYQLEIVKCIEIAAKQGKTVIFSVHDLNIAANICNNVLLLNHALQLGFAPVHALMKSGKIEEAFSVKLQTAIDGQRRIIYAH